jgi:NAD(P)-dependent dehydrogenase (short-subunit alcohol dehydrogenase family)
LAAKEIAHGERQGLCRDRCGRCDGRGYRPSLCARGLHGRGDAAQRRQAEAPGGANHPGRRQGPPVRLRRARRGAGDQLFREIETEIGEIEVFVFNIGGNVRFDIRDTTARVYRKVWEMTAFAGFLTAREAAKAMIPRGHGTMLFTGATASLRGGRGFSAFAGGKHAVRALAQSMARELGPQNIHVAHVVIDGAIDTEWIKTNFPERYNAGPDAVLDPDDIAEVYWQIHLQKRSAWTFEMDLRPWKETW